MALPTLNRTFLQLKKEVGYYLQWGRDEAVWSTENEATIEEMVNSGYRQFLLPPAIGDAPPHRWSFLVGKTATISLVTGEDVYDMPEDWGGGTREFYWPTAEGVRRIPVISYDELLTLKAMNDSTATPFYAAIHPKTVTHQGSANARFEVTLHPQPDSDLNTTVMACNYSVDLDALGTDTNYPVGGAAHSETLLESCLAVAELRVNDEAGPHTDKFMIQLLASVQYDQTTFSAPQIGRSGTWPEDIDDPATGELTFQQLCREIGKALGYGYNQDGWDRDQKEEIESKVNRGYRTFLRPEPFDKDEPAHVWSFLKQEGTITLADGDGEYDLPADFAGLVGQFHY